MNLSDFINKDNEKDIIDKLESVHNDDVKYYITFWYKDGTVSPQDIKRFLLDYESNLHFKTKIKVDGRLHPNDFIWYDIVSRENVNPKQLILNWFFIKVVKKFNQHKPILQYHLF